MFKNPRYETASAFYVGKKPQNKPLQTQSMARPREGSLHTLRWSDKVFAGDSVNFTAKQALGVRERDSKISASVGRQRVPDHQTVTDRLYPKREVQEMGDGLEGKVDLTRVRDARRAFRRKYAVRNNIDKIFDKYDLGGKGFITADDLYV